MKVKIFTILLIFSMLMTGCSQSEPEPTDTSETSGTVSEASETVTSAGTEVEVTETSETEISTDPITLTLFVDVMENFTIPEEDVLAEIAERTGVTLEITAAADENALDELIAAGELPDLLYAGERTAELAESGLLAVVPESGALTGLYGKRLDRMRSEDGNLYTYGTGGCAPASFDTDGVFQVRYSVLEELDYPEIRTLDQLEDCLRRYKELHPESTGLLLCGSPRQQWLDTVSVRVNYVLGYPDDGEFLVDEETGTAVYKWLDPRTGQFIKWLNKLWSEGFLDDRSFSLKHDAYVDRLTNGTAIAIADYREDYPDANNLYCPLPVGLDEDTRVMCLADFDYVPAYGIAVTTACKDTGRAFRFLDWLCVEGLEYALEEPFPMGELNAKDSDGSFRYSAAADFSDSRSEPEKSALEGYGVTFITELFPREDELPQVNRTLISDMDIPELSETAILLETFETYLRTEVPEAVMAPGEEFDSRWDEIVSWLEKNGADRLGELASELLENNS